MPQQTGGNVMKSKQFETMDGRVAKIAAPALVFFLSLAAPAVSQTNLVNAIPGAAVSSVSTSAPKGVKVLARVPLPSLPVTRMYTQWESGRNFLYIEHGGGQITTVDITKKRNPQVVNHEPALVEPWRNEQPAEGTEIVVSPPVRVVAGVDNLGGHGMLSILESTNAADAPVLQAFGRDSSNLTDRDRNLIFFASATQLVIVEDHRWYGMDYTIN
jgi:hypothetical protein